jgi:O-antigen ligase
VSQFGRSLSKPVMVVAAMVYFSALCLALLVWHLSTEAVLVLTLSGIGLIIMSLRPYLGVHVFIVTLFFENAFGESSPGVEEGISPMKIIGAVILMGWLLNVAMRRGEGFKFDRIVGAIVLFLIWNGISLSHAVDTEMALSRTFTYGQLAFAALAFGSVVDTPEKIKKVYWSIVVWATLSTIFSIAQYYLGLATHAKGLVGNRNLFAVYLNIAIVCAYLLHQGSRRGLGRLILLVSLPILFLGIGLTFSRGGLIGLAVTLLVVWYRVARQRKFLLLAASIGMIFLLTAVLPNAFWQRASSIVPAIRQLPEKDTFSLRVRLWTVALRMIEDRPIFGVGPGNFIAAFPRYARGSEEVFQGLVTHNTYLGVAAENGLVGGALFLLIGGLTLRAAWRGIRIGRRTARSDLEIPSVVAEVSLLVLFLAGLSGNFEGLKCTWIVFGLAAAMGRMAERSLSEQRLETVKEPTVGVMEGVVPWALARPRQ